MKRKIIISKLSTTLFFSMLLICFGCSSPSSDPQTRQMVQYLHEKSDSAKLSQDYPYYLDQALHKAKRAFFQSPAFANTDKRIQYALLMLLKGEEQTCINLLKDYFKKDLATIQPNKKNIDLLKILALAYVRLGERKNCLSHANGYACILPIHSSAVHQESAPMQQAQIIYKKLILHDTSDYQSLWYYNLSHQTLGSKPEKEYDLAFGKEEANDFPQFKNIAPLLGLDHLDHAGGSSLEDFNKDGYLDLFSTAYSLSDQSQFYLGNASGGFKQAITTSGLKGITGGLNNIHADFNNDGFTDIFIMRGAWLARKGNILNSLLINNGEGAFEDRSISAGINKAFPTGSVATADIDLDGDLDIFVGNEGPSGFPPCEMYINNGDGSFTDLAKELNLEINDFVKAAIWGDINNDSWPDLFLSIYGKENKLFLNKGRNDTGQLAFEDISIVAGIGQPHFSFTSWFWDYDNDGWQDILVFGYDNRKSYDIAGQICRAYLGKETEGEYPRLYQNNGDLRFEDVTAQLGLKKLIYAMGGNFGDLNNDGYLDFYCGTGEFNIWAAIPNRMFLNKDGEHFEEVTMTGGFGQLQKGHGVSFGDFDNDGDQDIFHQVGGAVESDVYTNMLFENPGFGNNFITLILEGTTTNRSAIGAVVELSFQDAKQQRKIYRQVSTGGSFGANSLQLEMGIGKAKEVDRLIVKWANLQSNTDTFYQVKINQRYILKEGAALQVYQ